MKNYILLVLCFLVLSCSYETEDEKNLESNNILIDEIKEEKIVIDETVIEETVINEIEIDEIKIEKANLTETDSIETREIIEIIETIEEDEVVEVETRIDKKLLDLKFYSQFPNNDFGLPFDEYCEESSLLGGLYYLQNRTPSKKEYMSDLIIIKKMEDKLFGKNGYKNTSIAQTNLILMFFQNPDFLNTYLQAKTEQEKIELIKKIIAQNKDTGKVKGKIINNPSIDDLIDAIIDDNPVIIPVYGQALNNKYFTPPGPIYHNILLKGYDEDNFIFNEVGTIRGEDYSYKKDLIMDNIHDFNTELYPEKYTQGDSKVLILYK